MEYATREMGGCFATVQIEDGKLSNVQFEGGCNGNLKAIGKLVEGADAADIARLLEGNTCGPRSTSCADQLSRAIDEALAASAR